MNRNRNKIAAVILALSFAAPTFAAVRLPMSKRSKEIGAVGLAAGVLFNKPIRAFAKKSGKAVFKAASAVVGAVK